MQSVLLVRSLSISDFFAELELVGIYKYHGKLADFLEKTPKLRNSTLFQTSSKADFDGETLLKDNPFSEYDDEEKLKLLEFNEGVVIKSAVSLIREAQCLRLALKKFKTDPSADAFRFILDFAHHAGNTLTYLHNEEKFSPNLVKKAKELYVEYAKGARPSDVGTTFKELFPIKEDKEKHVVKTTEPILNLTKEAITEIRQKMKENYEKQKK